MLKTSIKTLKYLTLLIVLLIQIQRNCAKTIYENSSSNNNYNNIISNHINNSSNRSIKNSNNNNNSVLQQHIPLLQSNVSRTTTFLQTHNENFEKAQPSNQPQRKSTTLTEKCKQTVNSAVVNMRNWKKGE